MGRREVLGAFFCVLSLRLKLVFEERIKAIMDSELPSFSVISDFEHAVAVVFMTAWTKRLPVRMAAVFHRRHWGLNGGVALLLLTTRRRLAGVVVNISARPNELRYNASHVCNMVVDTVLNKGTCKMRFLVQLQGCALLLQTVSPTTGELTWEP